MLGTAAFARNLPRALAGNPREQSQLERLVRPVSWARIIAVVEPAKEERWGEFSGRHGDWGRDTALWLARGGGRAIEFGATGGAGRGNGLRGCGAGG